MQLACLAIINKSIRLNGSKSVGRLTYNLHNFFSLTPFILIFDWPEFRVQGIFSSWELLLPLLCTSLSCLQAIFFLKTDKKKYTFVRKGIIGGEGGGSKKNKHD